MLDYFYGAQADQFTFYRVPKMLFTHDRYKGMSTEAKTLYGILLDRMNLSAKNQWFDENGRVYIIFTVEEIMSALGCASKKAVRLLDELEKKYGLITRKRQGLGKPNLIFVKNFIDSADGQLLNCQNNNSGNVKTTNQEWSKQQGSNTDSNNTENIDTDLSLHPPEQIENRRLSYSDYYSIFRQRLDVDILISDMPNDADLVEELLTLIADTYCTSQDSVRIGRDDKAIEVVRSQFMKLNAEHIKYVIRGLQENRTKVTNIRQYLLTAIYNAPLTMSSYYTSRVNYDLCHPLNSRNGNDEFWSL